MTEHVLTFSPGGASCACGWSGTNAEGRTHLGEAAGGLLREAVDMTVVRVRGPDRRGVRPPPSCRRCGHALHAGDSVRERLCGVCAHRRGSLREVP